MTLIARRSLLAGTATAAAATMLGTAARGAAPVRAAFVYLGPIGDMGWTYQHDRGRKDLEAALGQAVKTSFVEKVAEGPDAERVIRQLAGANDIVFATSFGYMNPCERVAKQFPKVKFEQCTGYKLLPNMAEYDARFYQGRSICGTLAGLMSKTGIAGYVGSVPIPEVVMCINAFTLAARKINPKFQTKVIWINSWFDPGKEADAAKALIDQGADFITQHTDSPAVMQVCEQRGIPGVGESSNMASFGPKMQTTATMNNWGPYYIDRVKAVMDGSWSSKSVWLGLKDDAIQMAPYGPNVPPEARAAADKVKAGIIAGTYDSFAGAIKDQHGQLKVPDGGTISDADLQKIDWYVEGVQA